MFLQPKMLGEYIQDQNSAEKSNLRDGVLITEDGMEKSDSFLSVFFQYLDFVIFDAVHT